jgi:cellulose biosynthesis protein BcsQ
MKSICFFNNKGGVGKTTLVCNIASFIATENNLRTIVVDADPQCNATELILGEERVYDLYRSRTMKGDRLRVTSPKRPTLFDVLRPIAIGDSDISKTLRPFPANSNRFRVELIPGDPRMALMEDNLSQAWLELAGGKIGGARRTNWATQLLVAVADDYDIVFFDVGPSLGALNRTVLIGADFFLTPMGCDIFSLLGIENIASWFKDWLHRYQRAIDQCRTEGFEEELETYPIRTSTSQVARFIGYTVQQYITKAKKGERRATKAYETIMERIPQTVSERMDDYIAPHLSADDLRLPDVPHMYSLIPLAQAANCPIHLLQTNDGLVGTQYSQKEGYAAFIRSLAMSILSNSEIEASE